MNSNNRSMGERFWLTYLGKISASNSTVLIPSRANAQAAYEPAGPPPATRTVVSSGIDMVSCLDNGKDINKSWCLLVATNVESQSKVTWTRELIIPSKLPYINKSQMPGCPRSVAVLYFDPRGSLVRDRYLKGSTISKPLRPWSAMVTPQKQLCIVSW